MSIKNISVPILITIRVAIGFILLTQVSCYGNPRLLLEKGQEYLDSNEYDRAFKYCDRG